MWNSLLSKRRLPRRKQAEHGNTRRTTLRRLPGTEGFAIAHPTDLLDRRSRDRACRAMGCLPFSEPSTRIFSSKVWMPATSGANPTATAEDTLVSQQRSPRRRPALADQRQRAAPRSGWAGLTSRFRLTPGSPTSRRRPCTPAAADVDAGSAASQPASALAAVNRTAAPLMVLGTSSGAGKSLMTAALCRVLRRRGSKRCPSRAEHEQQRLGGC